MVGLGGAGGRTNKEALELRRSEHGGEWGAGEEVGQDGPLSLKAACAVGPAEMTDSVLGTQSRWQTPIFPWLHSFL